MRVLLQTNNFSTNEDNLRVSNEDQNFNTLPIFVTLPILNNTTTVQALQSHVLTIHFNIIFYLCLGLQRSLFLQVASPETV